MKVGSMVERRNVPEAKRRYGVVPLLIGFDDSSCRSSREGDDWSEAVRHLSSGAVVDGVLSESSRALHELVRGQTSTMGAKWLPEFSVCKLG